MNDKQVAIRRITKNALMLALFCVVGMFSIPLGANIKVSLQLLILFIICLTADHVLDCIIVSSLYLVLGLFLPFYAGFSAGISPTFGFVISFVVISPIIYFMNKIPKIYPPIRMGLACLGGLIICYIIGSVFMMFYLNWDLGKTLMVSVVPYIPFDIAKIILAVLVVLALPKNITNRE
ncbi:MAG: biotin transporter BioY [Bacilli bacterium]|nr:biotin transporter BioY [Bacilli bacterium]